MQTGHSEHTITINVRPRDVYSVLSDVTRWPVTFPPTVHAMREGVDETTERIHLWATAGDGVKAWSSRRELHPDALGITFSQENPSAPIASMKGEWVLSEAPTGTNVTLLHDYEATDPEQLDWLNKVVDQNSTSELASLKRNLEFAVSASDLTFTFADEIAIDGTVQQAYDFIADADAWPERLPHVAEVRLSYPLEDTQLLEMDTRSPDGSVHTTSSYRVMAPPSEIVYKQTVTPALMTTHLGRWSFQQQDTQVIATSEHTVTINPDAVTTVLGDDASLTDAREYVRHALGTNSSATLAQAKKHIEGGS